MTADELIDGYVADVVLLLPRRQRRDVAQELRVLLLEEVGAAGGPAEREAAARALLAGFGRPADVAARYGSPVTIIDPADTRRFLTLAGVGAGVIVLGAVFDELIARAADQRDLGLAAQRSVPYVLGWLGLLLAGFAAAGWARRRRPEAGWKPHPVPTDRINRPGRAAAVVFFTLGTLALVDPQRMLRIVSGGHAAPAAYEALGYDDDFRRSFGPVVLALIIAGIAVQAILLGLGRWRPAIFRADLVLSLVTCAVLTGAVGAGPIFTATPADQTAKAAVALIVLLTLVDLAVRIRRHSVRRAVELHD